MLESDNHTRHVCFKPRSNSHERGFLTIKVMYMTSSVQELREFGVCAMN